MVKVASPPDNSFGRDAIVPLTDGDDDADRGVLGKGDGEKVEGDVGAVPEITPDGGFAGPDVDVDDDDDDIGEDDEDNDSPMVEEEGG